MQITFSHKKYFITKLIAYVAFCGVFFMLSCQPSGENKKIKFITLDPGHFHAALVQKSMYPDVDSTVYVYSPGGEDLRLHLERIKGYNLRTANPTNWNELTYTGSDFFDKMLTEKKGNLVVLSGNNEKKSDYILQSLQNGFHVLADKPMVIDADGFEKLKQAFDIAAKNKVLLYDIMTERFEITTVLQKELSMIPEIFGTLEKGTADNPAITKESVHHFYKQVSGNILTRPAWFLDTRQQGEGIVDVMTHLVDLVQWECFPEQTLDYKKDISVTSAKRWTTALSRNQFKAITKQDSFPNFLKQAANDTILNIFCNGEIDYELKGLHAKTVVTWNYQAPEGTGDTHYSTMRGTKANLIIRQGKEEAYKPVLYIEPIVNDQAFETGLIENFKKISTRFKGVELEKSAAGWRIKIPQELNEDHEGHFGRVTNNFLQYVKNNNMPSWEVPNMLAKYYTTIQGIGNSKKE
jgi:predicted dehydrogenase